MTPPPVRIERLNVSFGAVRALRDVDLTCPAAEVTALIGPLAAGKSVLLRVIARLADDTPGFARTGAIRVGDVDVLALPDPVVVRRRVAFIGERPVFFRGSVFDNVAFDPRLAGVADPREPVEFALRSVGLWDELEGRLDEAPAALPAGWQQRLCLARALANRPDVVLLDMPTRSLDPVAGADLEEVILAIRGTCTLVMAAHTHEQAARIADHTAFLDRGTVVEAGPTEVLFTRPREPATQAWLSRRYA